MTPPPAAARVVLGPYVPDAVRVWLDDEPFRRVEGALVSADISGFTALSERLAAHGREGAEELTELLNRCFGGMIEIVDAHGGDVLKFGGDALLILFPTDGAAGDAARRAAAACSRMRRYIQRSWSTPLVRQVRLGISQGLHVGTFDLHLVDAGHRELLVVGAGMSAAVTCEGAAERGQILVSHDAAAHLDAAVLGASTPEGRVLVREPVVQRSAGSSEPPDDGRVEPFVPPWLIEQRAAGKVAEHRTVTVGFVFFGGVDELLRDAGPAVAHERLQALATVTRDAASRHGVHWIASDVYPGGGKIILTAGAPRSTGQDEDAAVRTVREVLAADIGLPLRAGLNRGPVFMGDLGSDRRCTFTVMGDAVNLAARLMQKATPGQVVASASVLEHVPTRFALEPLTPFTVKGKVEPIHASLVGPMLDAPADDRIGAGPVMEVPFVGRAEELAVLEDRLAAAVAGSGTVVAISGEPGIGKSRLVEELLAAHDVDVLRAKGGLYSRRTPYYAASLMLRRVAGIDRAATPAVAGRRLLAWVDERAPELLPWAPLLAIAFGADVPMTPQVERIDPANRAARLRDVVVDLLSAVLPGPTVLVVDHAHRLDEASEELFAEIGRRTDRRPWMLLVVLWSDHRTFVDGLDAVVRLHVGPLSVADGHSVARAAAALDGRYDADALDDLLARDVTNPLFLLELVRSGIGKGAETPTSIEAVVTARIDTLAPADRLLLREAAVIGSVVDVDLLAGALDRPGLRRAERWSSLSGFLALDSRHTWHFHHGLYREVAYQGLSFRRRRQLHRDIGLELERRAGEDWVSSSELLSLHFHEARDWDRSWRYSVIAGDRARSKYANAEAAEFYTRALAVPRAHRPDRAAEASVAESLADALELDGRFAPAADALELARRAGDDPVAAVRLIRKSGVIRERQGHYSQALRWYGRGLSAASRLPAPAAQRAEGELALAYAGVRFRQGRLADTVEWAHRAERLARRLDDDRMRAHSAYLLMIGYGMLRRPEVADYRELPLRLFEQLGDLVGQANVLNNLGADAKDESRWTEALDYYQRSLRAREEAGDVVGAATAKLNIAEILSDQGHLEQARPLFEEALRAWRRADYEAGVAIATCYLGRLRARTGEFAAARRLLADALERFERIGATIYVLETRAFQLECEVLAGNGTAAVEAAGPVLRLAKEVGDPLLEVMVLRAEGWAHLVTGDLVAAEAVAGRTLELAEGVGSLYETALALIMRGQVRAATGGDRHPDHDRARRLLEQLGVVSLPSRRGV